MRRLTSRAFVGRAEQLGALEAGLARATAGEPGALLVGGEAGVGKTRLVSEFGARAEAAGARVTIGGCVELSGGVAPLLPVVEALRRVSEQIGWGEWVRLIGDARPELARLLPELGAPSATQDRALAQSRLFELLLGLLRRLADREPVVWIVEDVHWADASTLDLLSFVVRNLRDERALVVATFRDDETERRERLRAWLSWVSRAGGVERIDLARFGPVELRTLLTGVLGAMPERELAERVFVRSDGNAFIAEELLAATDNGDAIPTTLRDVFVGHLARLDPAAQQLVRAAAAIGRHVDHRLLAAVAELPEDSLLPALREAVRHRLLVPEPDGRTYGFRHALMREAASGELLPGEREQLHARIAEALSTRQDLAGGTAATVAGEIAHHWRAAGDAPRSLAAAVRAGSEAARAHAFADALELFEQALSAWDTVADPAALAGMDRPALLVRAAEAAGLAGSHLRAIDLADAALAELDPVAEPGRAGFLHARRGWHLWNSARGGEEALANLEQAIRLIPPEPPSRERAEALSKLVRVLVLLGRHDDCRERGQEALALVRRLGARALESELLNSLGLSAAILGRQDEGFALMREALEVAQEASDPECVSIAYHNLSSLLGSYGRFEEAVSVALEGAEASRRLGVELSYGLFAICNAAENLVDLGRFDEADELTARALEYDVRDTTAVVLHLVRADLTSRQGRHEAAERHLELAREHGVASYSLECRGYEARIAALVALQQGRWDEAGDRCADAIRPAAEGGDEMTAAMLLSLGLRAQADLAERARARRRPEEEASARAAADAMQDTWRRLREALGPGRTPSPEIEAHAATATAERARLDGSSAPARWAVAQAAWDELHMTHHAAYARWRRAEALLAVHGGRDEARALLAESHSACVLMGAEPLRGEIEALARRARIELPGPATPPADAEEPTQAQTQTQSPAEALGLTARELDVLALLADGRTNRQIAEALYISVKTAGAHVSSILRKLDATTRTQAAAVALHAGLLDERAPRRE
jgi:DNA-binding NarL/FixJ family response regulator/predicted negative regulator of RcsB-dependent stress response